MAGQALSILNTGMVSSVGLSAPAACAAIRSKLTNPSESRFMNSAGDWIMSQSVPFEESWRGREKLARMAAMVVEECLEDVPREEWEHIPLLLCIAERTRPGRVVNAEEQLYGAVCRMLEVERFGSSSSVVPHGRVSVAVALAQARKLLYGSSASAVLIVSTDSLLTAPTLKELDQQARLLTASNSNGFVPGEAAAGILVARPSSGITTLLVEGIGFGIEKVTVESEEPLRAEGLASAIKGALLDAGREMHEMDYRIADLSGEQYYFKEAALAVARTLRGRKEEFDIWHPAECIGESGAASGCAALVVANAAARKSYAPGPNVLVHAANDAGQRVVVVGRYGVP